MNELLWITLQVQDVEQARRFWRDVLGLRERSATQGWVELELRPDVLLALHPIFHERAYQSRGYDRGGPVLGLRVMDLEEVGRLVEREGAKALGQAHEIPGGRARDYVDPDGYVFELVQLN